MANNIALSNAQKLLDECRPKEALQYLETNSTEHTKEYYHLKAKILIALSQYKEALNMYSQGIMACKDRMEEIAFKSLIHREVAEVRRNFTNVYETEVTFMYTYEDKLMFVNMETYEMIEVDPEIGKYVLHNLEEEKNYILVTDVFDNPLNIVEQ